MADITVTAAQVAPVFPDEARIRSYIAAVAITAGQAVYRTSAGKADLADANGSGTLQFRGIALETVGAGQSVSVLEEGEIYGFTLAGAYDSLAYVSNTAGALADAAGGTSIGAGRVVNLTDGSLTKVLYIQSKMNADW
jgi:hypothetical protein